MDRVDVEFALTAADLIALRRYGRNRLPDGNRTSRVDRGAKFLIPFFFLSVFIFALLRMPSGDDPGQRGNRSSMVFLCLLILINLVYIFRRVFWAALIRREFRNAPANSPLIAKRKASVSPESFTVATPLVTTTYRWGAVSRIAFTRDQVFLFTAANEAQIIPRRAFVDETEWRRLNDLLKSSFPGQLQDETNG